MANHVKRKDIPFTVAFIVAIVTFLPIYYKLNPSGTLFTLNWLLAILSTLLTFYVFYKVAYFYE